MENIVSSEVMWLQQAESKNQEEIPDVAERAMGGGVPELEITCLTMASISETDIGETDVSKVEDEVASAAAAAV